MPNGYFSPEANTEVLPAVLPAVVAAVLAAVPPSARSTLARPARLSATNMSPFGAVRMIRGPARPEANRLTAKPDGTSGFSSVRCATLTKLATDSAGCGGGSSPAEI